MYVQRIQWSAVQLRLGQFPHLPFQITTYRGKRMLAQGSRIVATTPYAALTWLDQELRAERSSKVA